jgi:hypothetical protein
LKAAGGCQELGVSGQRDSGYQLLNEGLNGITTTPEPDPAGGEESQEGMDLLIPRQQIVCSLRQSLALPFASPSQQLVPYFLAYITGGSFGYHIFPATGNDISAVLGGFLHAFFATPLFFLELALGALTSWRRSIRG